MKFDGVQETAIDSSDDCDTHSFNRGSLKYQSGRDKPYPGRETEWLPWRHPHVCVLANLGTAMENRSCQVNFAGGRGIFDWWCRLGFRQR